LEGYDYSLPGAYFVTICTHNKQNLFGEITEGSCLHPPEMILSKIGKIANQELLCIIDHYYNIQIDKYTIMSI